MNIILDSNVIIAAFSARGLCYSLFELCLDRYNINISRHILSEINYILINKFRISKTKVKSIIDFLQEYCILVKENKGKIDICRDKDDNKILALCKNNDVKYIITGDNDLLVLKKYADTLIIKPREFWKTVKDKII